MIKITVTACPYCETQRSDSELKGLCRFCNTSLVSKEIELPDLTDLEKETAEKHLEDRRGVTGSAGTRQDMGKMAQKIN